MWGKRKVDHYTEIGKDFIKNWMSYKKDMPTDGEFSQDQRCWCPHGSLILSHSTGLWQGSRAVLSITIKHIHSFVLGILTDPPRAFPVSLCKSPNLIIRSKQHLKEASHWTGDVKCNVNAKHVGRSWLVSVKPIDQWFLTFLAPVCAYANKIMNVVCTFVRFLNMGSTNWYVIYVPFMTLWQSPERPPG